jgi:hypothetical protein
MWNKNIKVYVLRSDILNKDIIIGSECLSNFENDEDILKNAFVKKCLLCDNLNIGPIYILYGPYGPYLEWFNKKIIIPKHYIKDNLMSLESAIKLIKFKCQSVS